MARAAGLWRSEEHTSELQSRRDLVCRLLLEKKKKTHKRTFLRLEAKKTEKVTHPHTLHESCVVLFTALMFLKGSRSIDIASFAFFFNDTATTEIYTLSLHDALPI